MREIKFRVVWNGEVSNESFTIGEFSEGIEMSFKDGGTLPFNDIEWSVDTVEYLQYTGLHDKNGKEIYEGDVVSFVANYSSKPCGYMNGMVEFKDLQWLLTNKNGSYSIMEETDEFYAKSEIVANIYENPEFLNSLKI